MVCLRVGLVHARFQSAKVPGFKENQIFSAQPRVFVGNIGQTLSAEFGKEPAFARSQRGVVAAGWGCCMKRHACYLRCQKETKSWHPAFEFQHADYQ